MNREQKEHLIKAVQQGEGWRSKPYDCETGKEIEWDVEGAPTLAHGWNLRNPFPKEIGLALLHHTIQTYIHEIDKEYDWYGSLGGWRQAAVLNMYYILGFNKFKRFVQMIKAFERKDYDMVYVECLDSRWARRIGERSKVIATALQTNRPMALT